MEIKIDRYTKFILTLIAVALLANVFKSDMSSSYTPLNPQPAQADNIVMGSVLAQKGQRFITTSVDGKTVYVWFREEDQQWYDRDKVHFLSEEHVEE
jgi:hypothetical protein